MSELKECRNEIVEIDAQMASLFEKRMQVCRRIAAYKRENGLPVRDIRTEKAKIETQKELIRDESVKPYYGLFLQAVMDVSSSYQDMLMEGMRVAYGGTEGAYAQIAAGRLFPHARLLAQPDFAEAYHCVETGEADCAVLPIENSIAGEVGTVMDLMYQGSLYVNEVFDLPIRHRLLGLPGSRLDQIRTVVSHPQALGQCSGYLSAMSCVTETAENTSAAARRVKESGDLSIAAIASEETAEMFGLEILDHDIQNDGINTTRFAVFSRNRNIPDSGKRREDENFILVFTVRNEAGALASTLNIIGAHGYNMRNLKSRPLKSLAWKYYFYLEAEGDIHTQNGKDMLRELSVLCADLKLVGTFREESREKEEDGIHESGI